MIFHTVLLNLKPETTAEEVEAAMVLVRALPQKIVGITSVIKHSFLETPVLQAGEERKLSADRRLFPVDKFVCI
jgi:hypothetical protein